MGHTPTNRFSRQSSESSKSEHHYLCLFTNIKILYNFYGEIEKLTALYIIFSFFTLSLPFLCLPATVCSRYCWSCLLLRRQQQPDSWLDSATDADDDDATAITQTYIIHSWYLNVNIWQEIRR